MGSGRAGASLPGSKGALELSVPAPSALSSESPTDLESEFESRLFWMTSEDGVGVKYCARKRHSGKLRWLGMAWQGLAAVPRALRMNEFTFPI